MSAERLREAARVLRERAEACLPRQGDDQSWAEAFDADAYEQEHGGDGASDVRYIATMHPGVGLALARAMSTAADAMECAEVCMDCFHPTCLTVGELIPVADLILGDAS